MKRNRCDVVHRAGLAGDELNARTVRSPAPKFVTNVPRFSDNREALDSRSNAVPATTPCRLYPSEYEVGDPSSYETNLQGACKTGERYPR
ncbi:hypothetical protein AB1N83_006783 [Pleurotus pulmonarius]